MGRPLKEGGAMQKIQAAVIKQVIDMIGGHLIDYRDDMDKAYQNQDDSLTVTLTAKYARDKDGIRITTGIAFTTDKIKDGTSVVIDPNQMQLFSAAHDEAA